jgi:putative transposase
VAYPLRSRHVAERLEERGESVDHATIQRGVVTYSPHLAEAVHRRKRPVRSRWRRDATSITGTGAWRSRYRAVETQGQTLDVRLTEHRETDAARRFLKQAIRRHDVPEKITIDGSDAHEAAIKRDHDEHGSALIMRQVTDLHTLVEQDHGGVKRVTRPLLGCKSFAAAQATLVGLALMPMLQQGQLGEETRAEGLTPAKPCSSLAAYSLYGQGSLPRHDLLNKICDRTYDSLSPDTRCGAAVLDPPIP